MKKALKRGLSLLLAITIIFGSMYVGLSEVDFGGLFAVKAKAASESDLTFTLNDDGESYSVTYCDTSASGELVIPSTYNGLPVTSIGDYAFEYCTKLASINIGSNVESIGLAAFRNCIGFTSITIPSKVTYIGDDAFLLCTNLNAINVDENNTAYSSVDGVLFDKEKKDLIQYPIHKTESEYIIPDSVARILNDAFYKNKTISSITIPAGLNYIGNGAFNYCDNLKFVFYLGDETGWNNIRVDYNNELLTTAAIHYNATDHIYGDWTIDIRPTQTTDGEKSRHCVNCGERTDVTPIPHPANDIAVYIETQGVLCNGEIVYTVVLKPGTKMEGAIFGAKFDPDVLVPVDEKCGGCVTGTSTDTFVLNVPGIYVSGLLEGCEDTYAIGHVVLPEFISENDTEYIRFVFKVKDFSATDFNVDFYCNEFNGTPSIEYNDYQVPIAYCNNEVLSYDHTICAEWIIEKEANAVEAGFKYKACIVCGEELETEEIPQTVCNKPVITEIAVSEDGLVVSWDNVYGADSYVVYRKAASGWLNLAICTGTTYIDTTVENDTEYSYAIVAVNEVGESQLSDIATKLYHIHTMSDWFVRVAPTCTEYGESVSKCIGCEYEETETLEPNGHSYSTEWIIDLAPTCTEGGSKSHHCSACGDKADVTAISALGHNMDAGTVVSAPTCKKTGQMIYKCQNTGCMYKAVESIPVVGHNYSTEWTIDIEPTCTTEGSKSHHCTVCGDKAGITIIAATGHSYGDWVIDTKSNCTEEGSKHKTCSLCDDIITEAIEAKGHSYVGQNTDSNHPHTTTYKCSFCEATKIETPVVSGCVECNFTITAIDANSYKLLSYIGNETNVVIPATYNGRAITTVGNSCFKGNTTIKSVEIADGVTAIGSLVFMNCSSLKKVVIPASVTSIGTQAFYGFKGTIYCQKDSYAHEYAVANNIKYILLSIKETENTIIDYENLVIRTSVQGCADISGILGVSETAVAVATASYVHGNLELYGTGTIVTVFDGNEYIGDFTLVVEGDVNGDSVCDALDAMHVGLVSNGHRTLDGAYALAADSNADDIVDANDYQAIVNKAIS